MSRLIKVLTLTLVMVTVLLVSVTGAVFAEDDPIDMVVSPNVLNIGSNSLYIHIHADIGYDKYTEATVTVNDVAIEKISTFADDCGNLVVRFDIDQVKDIVDNTELVPAIFVLTYNQYTGTDSVPVIYPNK